MVHPCNKPCGNKTASGYCATTACINPQYSNIGTVYYGQGVQKRIITNADRIRSMTDEELSISLCRGGCPPAAWDEYGVLDCPKPNEEVCEEVCGSCWLDWLKQEATNTKEVINNSKT